MTERGPEPAVPGPSGDQVPADPLDAAHEALSRARRVARDRGLRPGSPAAAGRRRRPEGAGDGVVPRPGRDRDPHLLGDEVDRLVAGRGWHEEVQVGSVVGRWRTIVGEQVAGNVDVVAFEGTVLTVRARSTAWATQMRLLCSTVLARIESEVGEDVVTEILVQGPSGPSWRKGPLSSGGPGPRDTYG